MKRRITKPEAPAPIAIIGMACIFPQAPDLASYWNNILNGVDAISEPVPDWGAERYLAAGRIRTQRGGFLKDLYRFDPREFGIMPNSVDGGETDQYLALRVARDALADSGYLTPDADHHATGIILGHSAYLHRGQVTVIQNNIVLDQTMDLLHAALPHMGEQALGEIREILRKKLPPTTADNAPGLVPNMMTGRIANRLNLRGPNYVLDAACASSLLAVAAAADELRSGRSDMMLAGGVNATLPADVTTSFTQLGALSARGRVRPFEAGSDGTLLGEGLGVVVLKRLEDAITDGDRVYAVLRGVGHSSDGRGTGLLAPSQDGETLAIRRAYELTGIDPATVGLVEAHGTGIPLGDRTEIASLKSVYGERETEFGVKALGSVKSMISHCIPGAGIAGLIKMALALHHRVLPPTLCDEVNPDLGIQQTRFYINTRTSPWIARPGAARRAAVNSFGFGGINAHAILEQAPAQARAPGRLTTWPSELCVLSADSAEMLVQKLERLVNALAANPAWSVAEVAAALSREKHAGDHRVAILARDAKELTTNIALAIGKVRDGSETLGATRARVMYGRRRVEGQLGFIFPGEGSQYPGMFADLALFPQVQRWLDFWHGLYDLPDGRTRTDIVFPTCEVPPQRRGELEKRLHDLDVGSEAVFIGGLAMFDLLGSLGVAADVMVGHSSGESAALAASGANASGDAELAAALIRHCEAYDVLSKSDQIPTGALLAAGGLPLEVVESEIAALGGDVQIAMDNCSNQQVLYGSVESIGSIEQRLTRQGGICMRLPFDRGYHTPAFEAAAKVYLDCYKQIKVGRPAVPLYSCATAGRFPKTPEKVRELAALQWARKVRFRETIGKMHDDGVRIFLEVGPSGNLVSFVNDILAGREFLALPTNVRRRNGVEQLLSVLGWLYAIGRWDALDRLYGPREIAPIDLDSRKPKPRPPLLDNTMPMVRLAPADRDRIVELVAPPRAGNYVAAAANPAAALGNFEEISANEASDEAGDEEEAAWAGAAGLDADPRSTHANDSATPLLDSVLEHDHEHVVAVCRVSLDNDRFIRDHVLSGPVSAADPSLQGLACVPFMVSMELMAEACALLAGRTDIKVIENVRAFDWITLDEGVLDIEVRAEVLDRETGRYRGSVLTPRGVAVTGEFSFSPEFKLGPVAPLREPRAWTSDPPTYIPGRFAMFHGPMFQSLRDIEAWDEDGLDVALSDVSLAGFFEPGHTPFLILNPVLLDALSQVVPYWLLQYVGPEFHSFPSTIGRIELYEPCPAERAGIVIRARQEPADPGNDEISALRNWQFDCTDGDGRVLMRVHALGNLFFRVPPTYHSLRTNPALGMLGSPVESPEPGVGLWEVPLMAERLFLQSGGICARTLVHVLLGAAEREEWRALAQAALPRRREWLTGRAAIKEAVRHWVYECTGQLLYPADVEVAHDEAGAPFVGGWWCESLIEAPRVSLAHDAVSCIAAVAEPDQPVGVDLERMGRLKRPELIVESLAEEEKPLVAGLDGEAHGERVLRLWCAKEAASKCLGTGLRGEPWAFRIVAADPDFSMCEVVHETGTVAVTIDRRDAAIIAVGTLAVQQFEAQA